MLTSCSPLLSSLFNIVILATYGYSLNVFAPQHETISQLCKATCYHSIYLPLPCNVPTWNLYFHIMKSDICILLCNHNCVLLKEKDHKQHLHWLLFKCYSLKSQAFCYNWISLWLQGLEPHATHRNTKIDPIFSHQLCSKSCSIFHCFVLGCFSCSFFPPSENFWLSLFSLVECAFHITSSRSSVSYSTSCLQSNSIFPKFMILF